MTAEQSYDVDAAERLRSLRTTQKMLGTKAQRIADKHRANAEAITSALVAMGAETPDAEPSS